MSRLFRGRTLAAAFAVIVVAGSTTASVASTLNKGSTRQNVKLTVGNLAELTGVAAFLGPPFVQAGNTATKTINAAAAAFEAGVVYIVLA